MFVVGGLNASRAESEQALGAHPHIAQAAVIGIPDERLGERGCAVAVLKPGQQLGFADMVAFLKAQKVAVQYIPERLEVLPAMPATPSGKIQKFRLREMLRDGSLGG